MRSLTLWNPRSSNLFSNFDDLFKDFEGSFTNYSPAIDIEEKEDAYFLSVDLPGMKKENIKIDLENSILTLSGERVYESRGEGRHKERAHGFFKRSFNLPKLVDVEKIEAKFEDGVLYLTLPKAESAKARSIKIQ